MASMDNMVLTDALFIPITLTINLPAGGVAQNGKLIIEDAGSGNGNLIIYKGGQRFRLTGTLF